MKIFNPPSPEAVQLSGRKNPEEFLRTQSIPRAALRLGCTSESSGELFKFQVSRLQRSESRGLGSRHRDFLTLPRIPTRGCGLELPCMPFKALVPFLTIASKTSMCILRILPTVQTQIQQLWRRDSAFLRSSQVRTEAAPQQ